MSTSDIRNFFNKSKEDFIWFIKRALSDHKSAAHAELYHCLLKMFVEADTNNDGLVSKTSFSKLVDMAASIPSLYGDFPLGNEKTEKEKEQTRQQMFDSIDTKKTGLITFDEWYKFSVEYIAAKTATIAPHPILDHGSGDEFIKFLMKAVQPGTAEHIELFWYLVELFVDKDGNKDGIVTRRAFPSMVDELLALPKKLNILHPDPNLYEDDEEKRVAVQERMFVGANPRGDDRITLDEWVKFAMNIFLTMTQCATGFNKSKEDFIWFVKKAVTDKKSHAHSEMYQCLLKMFVEADTNRDGLVSLASFSNLIDVAASIPRKYGFAPDDAELYKTEQEKQAARQKMFSTMDLKNTGVITFDEWLKFCHEHILKKTATLDPHPILDHGDLKQFKCFLRNALELGTPEHTEMYWFLLEIFTQCDADQDGIVTSAEFPAMLDLLLAEARHNITHPDIKGLLHDKKDEKKQELFRKHNPKEDGRMCVDEWIHFAVEEVFKKVLL